MRPRGELRKPETYRIFRCKTISYLETLLPEDYNMVVMLINRLAERPSGILKAARDRYVHENPMSMEEIDKEIQTYRKEQYQ